MAGLPSGLFERTLVVRSSAGDFKLRRIAAAANQLRALIGFFGSLLHLRHIPRIFFGLVLFLFLFFLETYFPSVPLYLLLLLVNNLSFSPVNQLIVNSAR